MVEKKEGGCGAEREVGRIWLRKGEKEREV
jgi:hypothetical protein